METFQCPLLIDLCPGCILSKDTDRLQYKNNVKEFFSIILRTVHELTLLFLV